MTILTIETSTQVCSAAWCIDGACVAERIQTEGGNHSAVLPVFLVELLQLGQQKGWQADAVAVSEGPGSYTGLRIGLSMAKGLCYGWNVPLIPVPTLAVLCAAAQLKTDALSGVLIPMLDARRMEVYTQQYQLRGDALLPQTDVKAQVVQDNSWYSADEQAYFFGDGAAKCRTIMESDSCHFIPDIVPTAAAMGRLAEQNYSRAVQGSDLAYYTPFYLKEFVAAPSHVKGLV